MKYKYENTLVNSELERVDVLLRKGKYEDAYNALTWIKKNYGPSGIVCTKKGIYYTCLFKFDVAKNEYRKANISYIVNIGHGEDPFCTYHISKINKITSKKLTEKEFVEYINDLLGSENYSIPKDIEYTYSPENKTKLTFKEILSCIGFLLVIIYLVAAFLFL